LEEVDMWGYPVLYFFIVVKNTKDMLGYITNI
jgi:hypothetical protein